jgi:hypothetical protein
MALDMSLFLQVAQRGSILFFTVLSLQSLDPVYTFSSDWFMEVFRTCVQSIQSPTLGSDYKSGDLFEKYVGRIVDQLTLTIFHRVSYGILSRHFLPFSFKLCTMLLMHHDRALNSPTTIRRSEWIALLQGSLPPDSDLGVVESQYSGKQQLDTTAGFKKHKPEEISYETWEGAARLDKALHVFSGLLPHIINNVDIWVRFSKSEAPWLEDFGMEETAYEEPMSKSKRHTTKPFALSAINSFHRLILVNIFCPNQFAVAAKWFIERELSAMYMVRRPPDLEAIYRLTSCVNPALIIITPSEEGGREWRGEGVRREGGREGGSRGGSTEGLTKFARAPLFI